MENNEYSKFKSLNYEKNYDFKEFWEKNEYTKDIFENSRLFAQNYKYFNDIDECVYLVSLSSDIDEEVINDIFHGKEEWVICCFSSRKIIDTNGEKLMWAHYANSSKGIRIDFTIDSQFEKYVKKVEYKPKIYFENTEELVKEFNNGLENIMRRKSEVWEYEQEHRAIFSKYGEMNQYTKNNTDFFFPIKITEITFGRGCGFFPNEKLNNTGQEQENAKSHVIKIASFIYKVLKESNKYNSSQDSSSVLPNLPRFSYYEDKYSSKPVEIPKEELEKLTKLQDGIQSLERKIVYLKNRINNPIIPFYPNTNRRHFMTDLRHLSREEQKLLADVTLLVQNDDQEFNYEMLKAAAPNEASGEFWFRMAETLSTLPPNRSLDLRLNGGRLTVAVSILSVLLQDSPEIPQLWAQKVIALNYLAHGHQTRALGLAQQADKASEANEEEYLAKTLSQNLLSTLKDALARFPEDTWFAEMRDDAWKHFGAEQAV